MKVGIALGGGGVRGLAHIAMLEVLDELNVKPVAIAGTSMGAIIGALYASGRSGRQIREGVESIVVLKGEGLREIYAKRHHLIKWLSGFGLSMKSTGLLQADGLLNYLTKDIEADSFEKLDIPFTATATDYYRAETKVFSTGPLLPAVRASMSIPGVFEPVLNEGRILVDGGLSNQVPYDLLPADCDVTIGVDAGPARNEASTTPPKALDALLGLFDIMVDQAMSKRLAENPPSIYIKPVLEGIQVLDFDKVRQVMEQAAPAAAELKEELVNRMKICQ